MKPFLSPDSFIFSILHEMGILLILMIREKFAKLHTKKSLLLLHTNAMAVKVTKLLKCGLMVPEGSSLQTFLASPAKAGQCEAA